MSIDPIVINGNATLVTPAITASKREKVSSDACLVNAFKGHGQSPPAVFNASTVDIECNYLGFQINVFFVPGSPDDWVISIDGNIIKNERAPPVNGCIHEHLGLIISGIVNYDVYDYIECSGDEVIMTDFSTETIRLHSNDAIIPVFPSTAVASRVAFTIASTLQSIVDHDGHTRDLTGAIPLIVRSKSFLPLQSLASFLTPELVVSVVNGSIKSSTRLSCSR